MIDICNIQEIAHRLGEGGIIAYPTESVFGIGCLPNQEQAISRLLNIKQRRSDKGLILLAASMEQLSPWIQPLSAADKSLVSKPRNRATTWVVPARSDTPPILTGNRETIAIRLTRHPLVQKLCDACDSAIISTSANLSGENPAKEASGISETLNKNIDLIIDQPCIGEERPSQIIDLKTQQILRD